MKAISLVDEGPILLGLDDCAHGMGYCYTDDPGR
jgi:hypothetical protein